MYFYLFAVAGNDEETVLCERLSKTWTKKCLSTGNWNKQCMYREKAKHGACHGFPHTHCYCYFDVCPQSGTGTRSPLLLIHPNNVLAHNRLRNTYIYIYVLYILKILKKLDYGPGHLYFVPQILKLHILPFEVS